jgi:hypothetical protein
MSAIPAPPVQVTALTSSSFQAYQDGYDTFVIRETRDGWKTEGHPVHDGLLCGSMRELLDHLEGKS